jgi:outer membrane lipoprotein SlyB
LIIEYNEEIMKKLASTRLIILLVGLALSGCASPSKTRDKYREQGCLGGAAIGVASGAAIYGTQGAIIGSIAGCVAGILVGDYFAERKKHYASQQEAVLEETAWNREVANKLREENVQLAMQIGIYQQVVQQIEGMPMNDKQRQYFLREERDSFKQRVGNSHQSLMSRLKDELAESKQRYQQYQANANPTQLQEWQAQITALENERNQLNANIQTLLATNASF